MKVSVILPIYNGEKTLKNTLESLVNQSLTDFELIACIDGTNDNSENIIKSYRNRFKKLILLKNRLNRGLGATMNRLVSNASGEYIAIAEQDDFYYKNRLKLQSELLDLKKDVGLVSGIAEFWNGSIVTGKFPGLLVHGNQYPKKDEMFLLNYKNQIKVVNSCMMFRKSVHVNNGLYFTQHYPNISVDWSYILRFCLVARIYGLPEVLVRLDRQQNRNSITTNKENQFKAARELIRSFKYEFPKLISKNDYIFALNTQNIREMNSKSNLSYIISFLINVFKNPFEFRYYESLKQRIFKKVKNK